MTRGDKKDQTDGSLDVALRIPQPTHIHITFFMAPKAHHGLFMDP